MTRALSLIIAVVSMGWACTKPNPAYCNSTGDCASDQVCDLPTHTCVNPSENPDGGTMACSQNEQCSGQMPICGTDGACRVCELDDECASGVCRADGACEDAANVLYVAPNGIAAGDCASSTPCELAYARSLVTATRYSLRVADGSYVLPGSFVVTSPIASIAIVGRRNAVFDRASTGPSFSIGAGSKLALRGVTLHRGLDCNTGSIDVTRVAFNTPGTEVRPWLLLSTCNVTLVDSELDGAKGDGIESVNGGTLTVVGTRISGGAAAGVKMGYGTLSILHSTIAQHAGIGVDAGPEQAIIRRSMFFSNRKGGISIVGGGAFDVTNNYVYRNGNAADSTFGGMRLDSIVAGNRVEHNNVVRNDMDVSATPVYAGGIFCRGGGTSFNNIIANNFRGNALDANAQVGGTCTFDGSLALASDSTLNFVRPISEPFDYHLANVQSAAVNAGVTGASPVTDDFDGDPRTDGMPDVGADEL
jgi:hypothetical protein